jgi:hypothetical protein
VQSRAVSARQDYLRARRRQGCKQFNPPIEESVRRYAKGDAFAIPKATYVIAVGNKVRMEKEEERKQRAAA